jgi:hypothetical protein
MLIHPYTTQMAVVGWTSPVTATVSMTVSLQNAELVNCGNGIEWTIDNGATTLEQGGVTPLGPPSVVSFTADVQTAQTYYLTINSYQDDYTCDSTLTAWTITTTS